MKNEVWVCLKGYEGRYEISNLGRIKSIERTVKNIGGYKSSTSEKIKKFSLGNSGYLIVTLYKNNKGKTSLVHRLIAETFIPNNLNKKQVNHINGNKLDNSIENLEWVTSRENLLHAYKHKLKMPSGRKKLSDEKIIEIYKLYQDGGTSYSILAKKYNVGKTAIENIVKRKSWKEITKHLIEKG